MTPEKVTEWLQRPTIHVEPTEVEKLIKDYPYFVPARYMQATLQHNDRIYTPHMLGNMRLYAGNWLLFHELLETAVGRRTLRFNKIEVLQKVEEVIAEKPEEIIEPGPEEVWTKDATVVEGASYIIDKKEVEQTVEFVDDKTETADNKQPIVSDENVAATEEQAEEVDVRQEVKDEAPQETVVENIDVMKDNLIEPVFAEDYFRHQGIVVNDDLPEVAVSATDKIAANEEDEATEKKDPRSLMVVMSFTEWLMHFRTKSQKEKEEEEDRKAMKSMWQKEKLAAALEEEDDEIPEDVFEMAVHSLDKDEGLVSESLAEILTKQGKIEKAIDMYRKLSLRNPQKSAYFAQQISILQKNTEL